MGSLDPTEKHSSTSVGSNVDEEKAELTNSRSSTDSLPPSENAVARSATLRERIVDAQCVLLNTSCTISIVFMNKTIFADSQLRQCQVLIAMWHFAATGIVLYIATRSPFNLFKAVRLPFWQMVPISIFFSGFLLLGNLSLALNPVGFYQLAKNMTTPSVVLLNYILFKKTISGKMLFSIFSVCIGVSLTNSKLAMSNPLGAFVAIAAFLVTALYQIWIGKKIVDLNVSPPQLLLNQAPVSIFILGFFFPFVDKFPDVSQIQTQALVTLFGSGIVASLLNLSQFLIIGRTSALTFNIVGGLKSLIIVSLSWYQDSRIPSIQETLGVVLAIGGSWAYAQLTQEASKR